MLSDAELVQAVLSGERERFAVLIERHERSVRAIAFAVVKEHESAHDVTQDVFVEGYRQLATLRKPSSFGNWVRTMARNRAIGHWRRQGKVTPLDDVPAIEAPAQHDALKERCRQLVALADELPEHERTVVMLYYFDGHGVKEIAALMSCPIGTVTMRLSRARARLRQWLEEMES